MEQLLLFQSLNKEKTIKKVRIIVEHFRTYQNILHGHLKMAITPDYFFEFTCQKMTQTPIAIEAEIVVCDTLKALNKLSSAIYRRIIYEKFCTRYKEKDVTIANMINISETDFYRVLEHALLEFAEVYNYGELLTFD
ncbi:ArpU family phage packaging/lysis transcriptional regulator [Streptococcus hyointestinalis]|nr:ArpU family phage packaging/lysis transcriptional regulator [Streptococcus hyointestinalis]